MSRRYPYRLKPPDNFNEIIESLNSLHFFLVQENGPTCFIIKEESTGKKFKITIGDIQSCSCKSKDICSHILFVLIKILRVPQENPLLWQLSLVDSEVQQILQGRFRREIVKPKPKTSIKKDKVNEIERKPIEEDEPCPICQEEMINDISSTTYCKVGCGNSMHIKCMIVWAEHRQSIGESVTCPLCRADWGVNALRDLKQIKQNKKKPNNVYNITCNACHINPIYSTIYRCLFCEVFKNIYYRVFIYVQDVLINIYIEFIHLFLNQVKEKYGNQLKDQLLYHNQY